MKIIKILVVLVISLFVFSTAAGILGAGNETSKPSNGDSLKVKEYSLNLSPPAFPEEGKYVKVELEEATSTLMKTGKPMVPVITKTFSFPAGTRIDNTEVVIDWEEVALSKKIKPAPAPEPLTTDPVTFEHERKKIDESVYSSSALYPSEPYTIRTGSGIKDGEHVLYVNVRCNAQYSPANDYIKVPRTIDIEIEYDESNIPLYTADEYDLLIITHEKFEERLQDLVAHKESNGIKTKMVTVDEIYPNYDGVADWEDIKLYLADVVLDYGIEYVLLAGGRKGQTNEWYVPEFLSNNYDGAIAGTGVPYDLTYSSDLYFADVYYADQYGHLLMDDWDTNDNGIYAEGPYYEKFDVPDYYPDVYLGRIPLRYSWEADIIVDKIIEYENNAHPSWFKKGVLCGGDTTPPARYAGADEGVYEGEIACDVTGDHLSSIGFDITRCYTSTAGDIVVKDPDDVTPVISQGCGWVNMQTHSNPAVCGNFHPEAPTEGDFSYFYTIVDVRNFKNDGKYPLFVIDGCHSGQFNVGLQQAIDAGGLDYPRAHFLEFVPTDICSWALLQGGGGSIGSIGVTALGYGYVNLGITHGLGGWLMPRFAHAYAIQGKEYVGELWAQGITDYIDIIGAINTDEIDRKTIEERILFGDPSVKLGGVGSMSSNSGNEDQKDEKPEKTAESFSVDVPTWEEGMSWTYEIDNLDVAFSEVEGRSIDLQLSTDDFTLSVIEVQSDFYVTEFTTQNADIELNLTFDYYIEGKEPISVSLKLKNVDMNGEIAFDKTDLGIKNVDAHLIFDVTENLDALPIELELGSLISKLLDYISIPADINIQANFDQPYIILDFPLETGKTWGIKENSLTFSIGGKIESVWLKIANFFNNIFHFIPPEFAKYLPVIDIAQVLEDLGIPTEYSIQLPEMEKFLRRPIFESHTQKTVNVPAGSYDSYQVLLVKGAGELYYSPDAKMVVKVFGPLSEFIPIVEDINMELKYIKQ